MRREAEERGRGGREWEGKREIRRREFTILHKHTVNNSFFEVGLLEDNTVAHFSAGRVRNVD